MKASDEATDLPDLKEERKQTDLIRNRGMEGGLFRACMDKIRMTVRNIR